MINYKNENVQMCRINSHLMQWLIVENNSLQLIHNHEANTSIFTASHAFDELAGLDGLQEPQFRRQYIDGSPACIHLWWICTHDYIHTWLYAHQIQRSYDKSLALNNHCIHTWGALIHGARQLVIHAFRHPFPRQMSSWFQWSDKLWLYCFIIRISLHYFRVN